MDRIEELRRLEGALHRWRRATCRWNEHGGWDTDAPCEAQFRILSRAER